MDEKEFKALFSNFCDEYNLDGKILRNYFEAMKMNDTMSLEIYSMLLFNDCPKELFDEMKKELKELVKHYKDFSA